MKVLVKIIKHDLSRDARKTEDKTFVAAPFQPVEPGTEWERVAKLCDFNPKSAKNVKVNGELKVEIINW